MFERVLIRSFSNSYRRTLMNFSDLSYIQIDIRKSDRFYRFDIVEFYHI